jgi:hypothetical protein
MPATFDDLYEQGFQKASNANIGALRTVTLLPWSQAKDLCQKSLALLQWMNESTKEVRLPSAALH